MTSTNEDQSNIEDKLQPTTNVAHPDIVDKANVFSEIYKIDNWIINTSASDYMIRDSGQLHLFVYLSNMLYLQLMVVPFILLEKDLSFCLKSSL